MLRTQQQRPAVLVLEDGSFYEGTAFAGRGEVLGEVVFNTGMTGYQEIITDPSYKEQIVTMTYPLIGNYGINAEDMESGDIHLEALIVREYQPRPSNWRSVRSLKTFLEERGKFGIEGIDTRSLTRRIRISGAMRGIISTESADAKALLERVRAYPGLVGRDLVKDVTCRSPYRWQNGSRQPFHEVTRGRKTFPRVAVVDCGVKYNILRHLETRGCEVLVLPAATGAGDILTLDPDGLLLSNGPGDPAALPYLVDAVRQCLGKVPIFGICLGHQILGQALGGKTEKMKFGHHGINLPVKNRRTGNVEITSQNHGFVVIPESLAGPHEQTYDNLNDKTSEGIQDPENRAFSVQYHPEAAPGPHDATYLFDLFLGMMGRDKGSLP